jgi:hypothetical protein
MADPRKAIHAYLTPEAHDAWHGFAAEHGVSVSGLLEALAQHWSEQSDGADSIPVPELTRAARRIDAARRRRQRV